MARLDDLTSFIRESLARGIARPQIEDALIAAGWPGHQVQKALGGFAESAFPIPVPRPARHVSAGQAFAYLVLFTALAIAAHSIVELTFRIIDWLNRDPADPSYAVLFWEDSIRWSIARIVVALPVFLAAAYGIGRGLKREPAQRQSPVRRWLTYIAMFLAVCVLIGDLVVLAAFILQGEATLRFLLKVATVAIVAGSVLGYYLADLLRDESSAGFRLFGLALVVAFVVLAVAAVAGGYSLMRSPAQQAAERIDSRRVSDLRGIAAAVRFHFKETKGLPADLAELSGMQVQSHDPESGEPYEYRATGTTAFELCATFSLPSSQFADGAALGWEHGAGRDCFTFDASVGDVFAWPVP